MAFRSWQSTGHVVNSFHKDYAFKTLYSQVYGLSRVTGMLIVEKHSAVNIFQHHVNTTNKQKKVICI